MPTSDDLLVAAFDALSPIEREFVFLGGAVVPLYLNEAGRGKARQTFDADCTVRVTSLLEGSELDEELRRVAGLVHDTQGHIGRWIARGTEVGPVQIDVEPHGRGDSPRFYEAAVAQAVTHSVQGRQIAAFSLPFLFATKIAAYRGRGQADPYESKDLEDIVSLLQYARLAIPETINECETVRSYVVEWGREFLATSRCADLLEGHGGRQRARARIEALAGF